MVDKLLTIGIVVMLAASVVVLAWAVVTPRTGERFTQLAILGPGGKATDYPSDLTVDQEATVLLSVESFEHQPMNYSVVIVLTTVTDASFEIVESSINWDQSHALTPHVAIAQNFTLQHLDNYSQTFNFSVTAAGSWKLQFMLFTEGQQISQDPYREVHLWLEVA